MTAHSAMSVHAAAAVPAVPLSRSSRDVTWVDGTDLEAPAGARAGPDVAPVDAGAGAGTGAARDMPSSAAPVAAVPVVAPARPAWTIPEDYAGWDVDHHRFELKRPLGRGE